MPEIILAELNVNDAYQLIVKEPSTVSPGAGVENVLRCLVSNHKTRHIYVVDEKKQMMGAIKLSGIIGYMFPQSSNGYRVDLKKKSLINFKQSLVAMDVMNAKPSKVYPDTLLSDAVKIMKESNVGELPVVDRKNRLVGEINILEITTYYLALQDQNEVSA